MSPMVWVIILIVCLVYEFVRADLYGASGALGALAGLIAYAFSLHVAIQVGIAVIVIALMIFEARPIGMKYVNKIKKHNKMLDLEGRDGIVICRIDNAQGLGIVNIGGSEWSARSNRPNTVFNEGDVVTVVAMRDGKAYVDYRKDRR